MSVDVQRVAAELALERPQAADVFERLEIDYCATVVPFNRHAKPPAST